MSAAAAPPWLAEASTAQRVLLAWEQFLALLDAYNDRLALVRVDLDPDPEEDETEITRDRLLRTSGKGQDRLLGAFKQYVRRRARNDSRSELDIACDILVKGAPAKIEVHVKRPGRKASWTPRKEALFVTRIWQLMGGPELLGLSEFGVAPFGADRDLKLLRRRAVERHRTEHEFKQSVENLLDRFREALQRNPYLQTVLEFAEEIHIRSWLARHEALCVVGVWFHDHVARDQSDSPRSDTADLFRILSTQLAEFAVKRPPLPLSALVADTGIDVRDEARAARGAFHGLLEPDAPGGDE